MKVTKNEERERERTKDKICPFSDKVLTKYASSSGQVSLSWSKCVIFFLAVLPFLVCSLESVYGLRK